MRILCLDGSPKKKDSASRYILEDWSARLGVEHEVSVLSSASCSEGEFAQSIQECDAFVLVFPLYVDGIPAHLLRMMEDAQPLIAASGARARVYVVVQCGFFEGRQNRLALLMTKQWCEACGLSWGQGMGVGAGPMMQAAPIGHGPNKNFGRAAAGFLENICLGQSGETVFISPNFPRFLYRQAAHMSWNMQARKNGLSKKEIGRRLRVFL